MELFQVKREVPWNSMELIHEILILINFIIGEVYFTVCYMLSCYYISDNPLVVEILRYFNSKPTFWCPSFCSNCDIPSKWRPVIAVRHPSAKAPITCTPTCRRLPCDRKTAATNTTAVRPMPQFFSCKSISWGPVGDWWARTVHKNRRPVGD